MKHPAVQYTIEGANSCPCHLAMFHPNVMQITQILRKSAEEIANECQVHQDKQQMVPIHLLEIEHFCLFKVLMRRICTGFMWSHEGTHLFNKVELERISHPSEIWVERQNLIEKSFSINNFFKKQAFFSYWVNFFCHFHQPFLIQYFKMQIK